MANTYINKQSQTGGVAQPKRSRVRTVVYTLLSALVVVGLAVQLVPYGRAHTNPPVVAEPNWSSAQTRQLFSQACADCHSNDTVWPWYSNVAPLSWMIQNHVDEGRIAFNASEMGHPENKADEAAEYVQKGEMPIANYTWLHPEARLSATDRQALITGLLATFGGETGSSEAKENAPSSENEK